jgi:hypothetical protein
MSAVFEPSPHINYTFVVWCYAVASVVGAALAVSDLVCHVESVKGWWITLSPFPVCFVWAVIVRQRSLGSKSAEKPKVE